ncbi:MAG: hypothetical protein JJU28_16195 [Cyclobacteriaceae bacterium]|nr:hypothetical protein [Cyclobacteriaceae bacterium]
MSTPTNTSQKAYDHIFKKIGFITLVCVVIITIWKIGNVWIERVIISKQEQVSKTILKTIQEQANLNLLLPEIVFINTDTVSEKELTDSFKKQITAVLTKKYLTNEKVNPKDISFQPFFVFPESADSSGNYKLTKSQLDDLKNHIIFLSSQVDKAVTQTKDEINKEIDRINTWVSIWIGVLAIFGTVIPLFYNYKNNEDLKWIKDDAGEAKKKSENAHNLIEKHREDLAKVKEVSKDLVTIKTDFDGFKNEVTTAKESSTEALGVANNANSRATKVEKLISTLNDVSKIKDLDASFLLYNDNPFETLKSYLTEIHTNLSNCSDLCNEPIIKDVLRQLSLRLHLLSISGFIKNPHIFELLNQFALDLSNRIGQPFTFESYNEAIALLNVLNERLEREDTL